MENVKKIYPSGTNFNNNEDFIIEIENKTTLPNEYYNLFNDIDSFLDDLDMQFQEYFFHLKKIIIKHLRNITEP